MGTYGPIADWDVPATSDMSNLFKDLKYFNADISSWHTSGVTDMNWMFASAQSFNQPLSFDTSSVTTMESMFSWTASMSDTNRLLIRCAWAENNAFEIAYGSNWVIYPDGSLPDLNWVSGPCA